MLNILFTKLNVTLNVLINSNYIKSYFPLEIHPKVRLNVRGFLQQLSHFHSEPNSKTNSNQTYLRSLKNYCGFQEQTMIEVKAAVNKLLTSVMLKLFAEMHMC